MKNIKIISLIMVLAVIALCFVGCKDKTQNNNEIVSGDVNNELISGDEEVKVDEELIYEEYEELIEIIPEEIQAYGGAINSIGLFFGESSEADPGDYGVSTLITDKKGLANPLATLGYVLVDVNGDENDEFLIYDMNAEESMKNVIVSLYTLSGDEQETEVYHVLNSYNTDIYELCENNVLRLSTMGEEVNATLYCKIDESLKIIPIERIEVFSNEDGTISNVHYVGESEEGTTISNEEVNNINNKYVLKNVTISSIIK